MFSLLVRVLHLLEMLCRLWGLETEWGRVVKYVKLILASGLVVPHTVGHRPGRFPCISIVLSRMSSGIKPLPGFFEMWLRDQAATLMGRRAEENWRVLVDKEVRSSYAETETA